MRKINDIALCQMVMAIFRYRNGIMYGGIKYGLSELAALCYLYVENDKGNLPSRVEIMEFLKMGALSEKTRENWMHTLLENRMAVQKRQRFHGAYMTSITPQGRALIEVVFYDKLSAHVTDMKF